MRLALRLLAYLGGGLAAFLFILVFGLWFAWVGGCCQ
jgi:hypothetical protein